MDKEEKKLKEKELRLTKIQILTNIVFSLMIGALTFFIALQQTNNSPIVLYGMGIPFLLLIILMFIYTRITDKIVKEE